MATSPHSRPQGPPWPQAGSRRALSSLLAHLPQGQLRSRGPPAQLTPRSTWGSGYEPRRRGEDRMGVPESSWGPPHPVPSTVSSDPQGQRGPSQQPRPSPLRLPPAQGAGSGVWLAGCSACHGVRVSSWGRAQLSAVRTSSNTSTARSPALFSWGQAPRVGLTRPWKPSSTGPSWTPLATFLTALCLSFPSQGSVNELHMTSLSVHCCL